MTQTDSDLFFIEFVTMIFSSGYFWLFMYASMFYLFTTNDIEYLIEMRKKHIKMKREGKMSCGNILYIEFGAVVTYLLKPLLFIISFVVCKFMKKDKK